MEQIKIELFKRIRQKHLRVKDEQIREKISNVLLNKDNKDLLKDYTNISSEYYLEPSCEKWELLISMLFDEVEIIFTINDENWNINYGKTNTSTGEKEYSIKSFGKIKNVSIEGIEGDPYTIIDSEENKKSVLQSLLRNPLVLEHNDPLKALTIIQDYYPLPFFEKEAFKLRLIRRIEYEQPDFPKNNKVVTTAINLESIFSREGILSLQRKAAIRIRVLWKGYIKSRLAKPYSDIIDNGLNI